jgi:hypothetical protein
LLRFYSRKLHYRLEITLANSKDDDRKKKAVDKSPVHATVIPTMDKKSQSVVESGKESQTIQREDAKELRAAIKSESQNAVDKIEGMKDPVTDSLEGRTILETQDEMTAPPRPESQVPTKNEVAKQTQDVQEVGASSGPNVDRVELSSNMDYVYPFTFGMAIWQDFVLSALNTYNEFARELSRLQSNWMNIFLNVWQGSNHEK